MAEMDGQYVNEGNHQKFKRKLNKIGLGFLIVGIAMLAVGITLFIIGLTRQSVPPADLLTPVESMTYDMSNTLTSMGYLIGGGFLFVIGFGLTFYGVYALFFAHARDIAAFGASSIAPVVNDTVNYVADNTAPAVNKAIGGLAENITSGIVKGKQATSKKKVCSKCQQTNDANAKFCDNCGEKLQTENICPNCGEKLEEKTKFCPNCGNKIK